jgi:microfibrillar-associated protein 1
LKRDVIDPTLEDNFNKELLPEVMQVRDFGKAGRTKWTHLTKEDTSRIKVDRDEVYIASKPKGESSFTKPSQNKRQKR